MRICIGGQQSAASAKRSNEEISLSGFNGCVCAVKNTKTFTTTKNLISLTMRDCNNTHRYGRGNVTAIDEAEKLAWHCICCNAGLQLHLIRNRSNVGGK